MKKDLLLVLVNKRKQEAPTVQKILTGWGCVIKTRLGIHDGVLDECTDTGLIILELAGEKDKHEELAHKLDILPGVSARLVELSV
ncbi:MAG: hypothetical protein DRP85_07355 [Candidatus Makaraimicrobium thalassicum]|nr:MAG: hypothetical protein DRP85_07355 [Candidatus Omnitrophota bacterium]